MSSNGPSSPDAPSHIRNFAVVGHASAGKTMLCEAMLVCSGAQHRLGSIADGSTVSDYHQSERERQISVHASLLHTSWMEKTFNLIDTPGYLDFISEGLGALRVGDFALVVVHALHGVGVGTEQVWDYATQYGLPKVLVINGLDKDNVQFDTVLSQLKDRFGQQIFPVNLPVNPGPGFNQVLDVFRSEIVTYQSDASGRFEEVPAQGEWEAKVKVLHKELIEHIAESDDSLLEEFFEQGGLSEERMRSGIHAAVQKQTFIPLFCTSAQTNVGVARLMDFIAKYGASPTDRQKVQAADASGNEIQVALGDPNPVLYIFKTLTEAQFGDLSFFRLYSGSVSPGAELYNSDRNTTERLGQLYRLNGRSRSPVNQLHAGDIGAVVKLRDTHTGNTLSHPKHPVTLPKVIYPKPNIHAALKLNVRGEEDRLAQGLAALHEEDPTFLFHVDPELHQTVLSAQGALHLEVITHLLRKRHKLDIELLQPRIAFRETITAPAEAKYRHKKQSGGAGQFGEVWIRIEPKPRDSGIEFIQTLSGQNVDRVFVPAVAKGVANACAEGILAGCRVTDVKIDFYDGKTHPVDSKDIAFQVAGYHAFKEAFLKARPRLLEPILALSIRIPEDCMGKVMSDLSARRGRILGVETDGPFEILRAQVPARELYQYSTNLRSLTGGRGTHSETFDHYSELPANLEQQVVEETKQLRLAQD